ncbi:MAG: hypothetical protein ABSH38_04495 [Verrucomicrobiota bacterium]
MASINDTPDGPSSWNLPFIEQLCAEFARDPASAPPAWRRCFQQLKNGDPAAAPDETQIAVLQCRVNQKEEPCR